MRIIIASLLLCLGAGQALADNHLDLGLSYRAGLTYDDDGLNDNNAGDNAKASSTLAVEFARIMASGKPADNVSYTLWYQVSSNELHMANARLQVMDMLGFTVGRVKTAQGGYDTGDEGHSTVTMLNEYFNHMPFDVFASTFALHFALAGELSLYIVEDVKAGTVTTTAADGTESSATASGHKNESDDSVAPILEWMGNFNGWMPRVQFASYDLNKSMYFGVGVKGGVAGVGLMAEFIQDTRHFEHRGTDGGKTKNETEDVYTMINVNVDYALKGFTPFVQYRSFDVAMGEKTEISRKDADTNSAIGNFDDNATSFSLGTTCTALGDGYVPYISWSQKSGTFYKDATDTTKGDESLSKSVIKLGVHGIF